jgi:hypothetical protein
MTATFAKLALAPVALLIAAGVMTASANVSNAVAPEPPTTDQNVSRVAVENAVQLALDSATTKR